MIKYLILDFGKVLAYPTTGNWSITPKFIELVDLKKIDKMYTAIFKVINLGKFV